MVLPPSTPVWALLINNVDEVARVTGGTDGAEEEVHESNYLYEIVNEVIKDAPHP